jgi:hypothetical protein
MAAPVVQMSRWFRVLWSVVGAVGEDVEGMSVTSVASDRLNSETNDDSDDRAEGDREAEDNDALTAGEITDETWYGQGSGGRVVDGWWTRSPAAARLTASRRSGAVRLRGGWG